MKKLAAIILAAGYSRRYGDDNKLLADLNGKPILSHVLECIAHAPLVQRLVIVNPDGGEVASLCGSGGFDVVENADAECGMGSSIAAGICHLNDVDGVMVVLGDMPFITDKTCARLIEAFHDNTGKTIFAPRIGDRLGHPVIFRRAHFDALKTLKDDVGAKAIITANKAVLAAIDVNDPGIFRDIDRP